MLIFDGDCGFCSTSARWIQHRVPASVQVVPFQHVDDLAALGLTREDVESAAYWVDDRGLRRGHRAVAAVLRRAGFGWRLLGSVIDVIPLRWLAAVGYRLVARYRYRLPGGTPACKIGDDSSSTA